MARTVDEIKEAILAHQFSSANYSAHIYRLIDEAQRFIFRRTNLRIKEKIEIITTVVGTSGYTLPSDYGSIRSLLNTTNDPDENLTQVVDPKVFDEFTSSSGTPEGYIIRGTTIELYPTPDAVYTLKLKYNKVPSSIFAEHSASPSIADDFYYLIEAYVLKYIYAMEQDVEMSNFWDAKFATGLVAFEGEMAHDTDDATQQIEGGYPLGYPW